MSKLIRFLPLLLLLFMASACDQRSGVEREPPAGASRGGPDQSAPVMQPLSPDPRGTISGTISVDPSLAKKLADTDVLYIIARSAEQPGPPVAVQQVMNVRFPYRYSLSSQDLMMQTGIFQGRMNVVVRLDRDGAAGPPQPGDMEGVYPENPASVGDQNVNILIDKEF